MKAVLPLVNCSVLIWVLNVLFMCSNLFFEYTKTNEPVCCLVWFDLVFDF